jgi:7-cyano-7-deazaguanine synthase
MAATKQAVILLSGGLDSSTVLAYALQEGYTAVALSFDYGQRHKRELECAKRVAAHYKDGVREHIIVKADLSVFGGSALTDARLDVPKNRDMAQGGVPVTYVPARNTLFLSYALACAETRNAFDVFIGANHLDYSGYPDCRPEYLQAYESMANLALAETAEGGRRIRLHAPLLYMSKKEIVELGTALGVPYGLTHSCYAPSDTGEACGECDSCRLRLKGFAEAGRPDPAPYAARPLPVAA